MRIVNLSEFLAMPPGTVFAKYTPQMFDELCIKSDSIHDTRDFTFRPLWHVDAQSSGELCDLLAAAEGGGVDLPIDLECWQRDGCFHETQLFAVFSNDEVLRMAASLSAVERKD
jgi:hypothetical protein